MTEPEGVSSPIQNNNQNSSNKNGAISSVIVKARILSAVKRALETTYDTHPEIATLAGKIIIDRPADPTRGEYSTNIALIAAKVLASAPVQIAVNLVAKLNELAQPENNAYADPEFSAIIEKIEVAGAGFINFYLKPAIFQKNIRDIVQVVTAKSSASTPTDSLSTPYGALNINHGIKIAYEYTDPNPFKVFHIGHLMANTIGESLSRLGEFTGATIKRFCYQGDLGRHVALFVFGLRFMDKPFPTAEEGEKMPLVERMYYMGTAYAKGATHFKNNKEEVENEVQTINKKLYDRSDDEINQIYDLGLEWSLQYFETLYQKLGTKFDQYFFESRCVEPAKVLIENGLKKGIFTESEGAIVFEGEKYNESEGRNDLHTRVFITKFGLPTYDAKELGLAQLKYGAFQYDKGIVVTANEQDQYFKVNLKVQELILPEITGKNKHVSHGMMILPTGKMSSRTGDVVSAEEMLESARVYALEVMKDREMTDEVKQKVADQIAVAGIRYLILRQATGKDVVYDNKKALSFEGDSGPYLQYTAVRSAAVLEKAREQGLEIKLSLVSEGEADTDVREEQGNDASTALAKQIFIFPEIVLRAYEESAPHHIAGYLTELAASFNAFYAQNKIIDTTDEASKALSLVYLELVAALSQTLKNGLYLLGIEVPERM